MHAEPYWSIIALFIFAAFAVACAEARNPGGTGGTGGSGDAGGDTTTTSSASGGAGGAGGSSGATGGGGSASMSVTINEIGANGDDFIELLNTGSASFSLAGLGLADSLDSGEPKVDEALRFPDGTTIAAGERVVIVAKQDAANGPGPHTACLPEGPATCFYATWGVSASKGESVFLLSEDDDVLAEAAYPMGGPPEGQTWGRLPDGTGDFTETARTPGEVNAAP